MQTFETNLQRKRNMKIGSRVCLTYAQPSCDINSNSIPCIYINKRGVRRIALSL